MRVFLDNVEAVLLALLVHVLAGVLMIYGLQADATHVPQLPAAVVQATIVDMTVIRNRQGEQRRQKQLAAEEKRREVQRKKRLKDAAAALEAQKKADEMALIEQRREEQQRQQLRQRIDAQKKKREEQEALEARRRVEQKKQIEELRQARESAERDRRREEQRLAQLEQRRDAAEADRQRKLEEERRLQLLAREQASLQKVQLADLQQQYVATIQSLVTRNWLRPPSARRGLSCRVRISQIPGGEVIDAAIASPCNADDATRRSIIAAVMKAQPLPYQGFEKVFNRQFTFNFLY